MEPLPAGARVPPAPPRPPAPPTTGWRDRPPSGPAEPPRSRLSILELVRQCWSQLRKVAWPSRAAVGHNTALVVAALVLVVALLVAVELVAGTLLPR